VSQEKTYSAADAASERKATTTTAGARADKNAGTADCLRQDM